MLKWRSRIKTQAAILVTVPFENAMDQGIVAAEGRREELLQRKELSSPPTKAVGRALCCYRATLARLPER